MSSISRARSAARRVASAADAGMSSGSSGARPRRSRRTAVPQASVSSARLSWRARRPMAAGQGEGVGARASTAGEKMVLLVGIADRADDGQDRRVAAQPCDQRLAEGADGAPGGQEDGDAGKRQRVVPEVGNGAEAAIEHRLGENGEKRCAGRDGEDVRGRSAIVSVRRRCRRSTSPPRRSLRGCRHAATPRPCGRRTGARPRWRGRTGG